MTRRLPPRRLIPATANAAVAALLLLGSVVPAARAQQVFAPGTPDPSFAINRNENVTFIPAQFNLTPFALALQPGRDPVQPDTNPNTRELPSGQTKLLIAGDGATLFRTYLTRTVNATTVYNDDGVPVTTYSAPFLPGAIDNAFFASPNTRNGIGNSGRIVYSLSVNPDGSVFAGGRFGNTTNSDSFFKKQERNFVLLNFNGDPEANANNKPGPFNANVNVGANDSVLAILRRTFDEDGKVLLGGQFTRFNKTNRGRLVQLQPDGTPDVVFNRNLGSGASGIVFSLAEAVDPATGAPNGQVYVCGDFDTFNGNGPGKLVRLNADGTRDLDFAPTVAGRAIAVAVQPNGQVLLGGDLNSVNGEAITNLARLNPDGTLDGVFVANARASLSSPRNIPPTSVYVLRVQPDGRVLVGGNYLELNDENRRYLGRLNADGTLDTSFDTGRTLSNATQSVVYVPRDPSAGDAIDLIYSQTRADRKEVPGDEGFYPTPVRRLFGDNTANLPAAVPGGSSAPVVRIGAVGPVATVGNLATNTDVAADPTNVNISRVVDDPGSPGVFRVSREGSTSAALTVRVRVVQGPGQVAAFNSAYDLRQVVFTPASTTLDSIVTTSVTDPFGSDQFDVTLPVGEQSVDLLVEGLNDGIAQGDQTVTLELGAAADGSYSLIPGRTAATVVILANNL